MGFGHCAFGLAAKPLCPKLPLGVLIAAPLLLDLLAIVLGFAGIEGVQRGFPWSHGLAAAVVWSLAAGVGAAWASRSRQAGVVNGALVLSHWVLDYVTHPIPMNSFSWSARRWNYGQPLAPDLPLLGASGPKVGLGLYNAMSACQATGLEVGLVAVGIVIYCKTGARRAEHDAAKI
jgi:hypothetical protein